MQQRCIEQLSDLSTVPEVQKTLGNSKEISLMFSVLSETRSTSVQISILSILVNLAENVIGMSDLTLYLGTLIQVFDSTGHDYVVFSILAIFSALITKEGEKLQAIDPTIVEAIFSKLFNLKSNIRKLGGKETGGDFAHFEYCRRCVILEIEISTKFPFV